MTMLGHKHTPEARAKISAAKRRPRKPLSPEHKAKIAAAMRGNRNILLPPMSHEAKVLYRKLRNCGLSRADAIAEATKVQP